MSSEYFGSGDADPASLESPGSEYHLDYATPTIPKWYAVCVKHQHEKAVARTLAGLGLETFLPLYRSRRTWSDRIKILELPLFSGYVFARFAASERLVVLVAPGVRSIVSSGGRLAAVSEEEIASLQRMVSSGAPLQPYPFLQVGQTVRIERGPLRGVKGILLQCKGSWRVVVSIEILQRSVAAEVDREDVVPCKTRADG